MLRKILCTCLLCPNKNKVKSTSAFTHEQHKCAEICTKKGSSMNRAENNRSPIFCVCELLVSDIEEALSRSQCLRATMRKYKLCNSTNYAAVRQLFIILHPPTHSPTHCPSYQEAIVPQIGLRHTTLDDCQHASPTQRFL